MKYNVNLQVNRHERAETRDFDLNRPCTYDVKVY